MVERRQDGRPEAYDIPPGSHKQCHPCLATGKTFAYPYRMVFLINPNDSPLVNPNKPSSECFLCREHLLMFLTDPVIVDPAHGFQCRDLAGRTWYEDHLN